ncbi:MAG: nucleoside deaminase [Geobacter sp.]|nr:nucleoside deaminase [Geobacter sp.]
MSFPTLTIMLPDWVAPFLSQRPTTCPTVEERMDLVLALAGENMRRGGGPFAAAIFEEQTGRLVAPGVNLVVPLNCSLAHAEMVAIGIAQKQAGTFDLGMSGMPALQLVTSTEPCAMCLGAVPWSGVRSIASSARGEDAEKIGFDEGAKPISWADGLLRREIRVIRDVLRDKGMAVLAEYAAQGGIIYNGRQSLPVSRKQ